MKEQIQKAQEALGLKDRDKSLTILTALYEAAVKETLNSLLDAEQASQMWEVSPRRARAIIQALHQKKGVGRLVGSAWVLTKEEVEANPPLARHRKKKE